MTYRDRGEETPPTARVTYDVPFMRDAYVSWMAEGVTCDDDTVMPSNASLALARRALKGV